MDPARALTELTTGATDGVLAVECFVIMLWLKRAAERDRRRIALWRWVFGLLAFSSLLGAAAHGVNLPENAREALWKPLYLGLGILTALFLVGAVHDWRGKAAAAKLVPWAVGSGAAFFNPEGTRSR